jgi:hypothetical protein
MLLPQTIIAKQGPLMQINLLWQGLLYHSLEHCAVTINSSATEVNSIIIGQFEGNIFRTEYLIRANQNWETVYFEIKHQLAGQISSFTGEQEGRDGWIIDGERAVGLNGCLDIDISLTPFTNSLPINRLRLSEGESSIVDVLYVNVLEGCITRTRQRYTRLSETDYKYENVPDDFEAVVSVDELGFVINYPGLFVRNAVDSW